LAKRGCGVAKKGEMATFYHMNVGLDEKLFDKVNASAGLNERTYTQEVRYALRKFYGIDPTPAEDTADVAG
jgi:hypothetical protein